MKPSIKLTKITLRDSLYTEDSDKNLDLRNVTIIVGPNNSGKSQILKDIHRYLQDSLEMKLIQEIKVDFPRDRTELTKLLEPIMDKSQDNLHDREKNTAFSTIRVDSENKEQSMGFNLSEMVSQIIEKGFPILLSHITKLFVLRLNGRNRFELITNQKMGSIDRNPNTTLQKIFQSEEIKKKIKDTILEEFGLNFYTSLNNGAFEIRLSPEYNKTADENVTHIDAIKFFQTIPKIEDLGDGVQCFTGLIIALHSVNSTIFCIDEPEAFLHPPQARHLAHNFVQISNDNNSSLLVSTHSSNFLMGCLEKTEKLNILRMTYDGKIGTCKMLDEADVKELIQDPLLRSTKTLEALFHQSAVIVEADADRILYEEINRRLNQKNRGQEDTVFVNGVGKDVLHRMISGLRKIGVPTACIYDLDFIEIPENVKDMWEDRLKIFGFTQEEITQLNQEMSFLLTEFEKIKSDNCANPIKKKGIYGLAENNSKKAETFLKTLSKKGLHLVPVGTLEEWLTELGVEERKYKLAWLIKILEKLGKDNSEEFVEPKEEGIWKFIDELSFNKF